MSEPRPGSHTLPGRAVFGALPSLPAPTAPALEALLDAPKAVHPLEATSRRAAPRAAPPTWLR
ncbi:MAG: hypothetical protein AAFN13_16090, partial [Bacteroidota bacterium]